MLFRSAVIALCFLTFRSWRAVLVAVIPLVVIPPVLVGIIAANSLLGGGRGPSRSPQARELPGGSVGRSGSNGSGRPPSGGPAANPGEPPRPR